MIAHFFALLMTQTWQITVLAIVVAVVVKLTAKNRPHLAHALWVLVLIKCVTPPLWGHSLGVFSQLQARLVSNETASLPDVNDSPASVPIATTETLIPATEMDVLDLEYGQPETYEPDELLSLAGTDPLEDMSQMWVGGTGIELDEAAQTLDKQEANVGFAEPALSVESVESGAGWCRPDWLLLSGLVTGAMMTLFAMVIRCLRCLREIHRHRTTEFDDQLRERVQQISRQLRVRRIPRIIVSDVLFGPAVLGLLRHTIVLPRCLFENAEGARSRSFLPERTFAVRRTAEGPTSAQRQSDAVMSKSSGRVAAGREVPPGRRDLLFLDPILAHELLHIRRGDLRTGTLQAIVQSLWWFHPAVWLSNRWLSREAERCCDEQVIAELGCSPAQYARSLLSVIECKHQLQPIPVFPGMKPVEITTQRMERIMSLKNGLKKRTPLWCWLTVVALALVVLPGAVAKPSVDEVAAKETNGDTEPREKDDVRTELPEIDGNMFWSDTDLRKHLGKRDRTEDIESATTLDDDCESIKLKYREVGFFDVEVKAQTSSADDPTNHTVRFEVKEGSRYTVREVRFEGNNRISASVLRQESILKPGDKYSAFKTSKEIQRIRELYKGLSLEPATINPVPHFNEASGVLALVFEIDEGLKALIRLDESFIPSPGLVLSADTVLAFVGEKAITVCDVVGKLPETLKEDSYLTDEARQRVLLARVVGALPFYLYDEVVIFDFEEQVPKTRREAIIASFESPSADLLEKMCRDRKLANVRELEAEGFLTEKMRESFERQHIIVGYTNSSGVDSPVRNKDSIQQYCRQLLLEARLRAKVSLSFDEAELKEAVQFLEETYQIRFVGNYLEPPTAVTVQIKNEPLLSAIKAIVEPAGLRVTVGQNELLLTSKTEELSSPEKPVVPNPVPGDATTRTLRVPPLPLPEWLRKSSDPLVKLVWDAREASRRRLLMTDQRTPWQFMNGLMALRRDFVLRDSDEIVNGLEWAQSGPKIPGDPWFQKTEHGGQPDPDPAPIWFDDHAQAFLAALAMSEVPIDAKFATPDGPITMGDMIKHFQMTVKEKNLSPWTLCALSRYLSPDAKWVNADSEEWSVEKLLQIEVDKPDQVTQPMVLFAIACARNQYLKTDQSLRGVWQQADQEIHTVIQQEESMLPGYRRMVVPRRYPHMKVETRPPRFPPVSSVDPGSQARLFREAVRIQPYQAPYFDTFSDVPKGQMLLFFITALPDEQLQAAWLRNAVEAAAIDLLSDWGNAEIRSPFYETTQALSIYLERMAVAGSTSSVGQTAPFTVRVKGQVRNPGVYQASVNKNRRLTDSIQLAGGATDDAVKTVYVIRSPRKKGAQPTILQIGYNGAERGAEPNIFLAPGDEVLLQSPEFVKKPLADSIRLDDSFVMSPEMPITGSSVIAYVNDRPITVERSIGTLWDQLEKTHGVTEELKRQIALESIASGLSEFVYQELVLQHFLADLPELRQEKSPQQREATDKRFSEALASPETTDEDPRRLAQLLGAILASRAESEFLLRTKKVDEYVRGLHDHSIVSNKSAVIKHVQELVTTARLKSIVSLNFTNASLAEVVRSINKVHGIGIEVNSLHAHVSNRIFDKPTAIEFHCQNKQLGEAIKDLFEPFGLKLALEGDSALLQFADSRRAMEKFRSLPGPASFGVFGIVKNNGWQLLDQEILLLDAIALAGGIADSEGVTIEITNPEIMSRKAIPVSMSLQALRNDKSGRLNRVVKDGDMMTVTRNGFADALPAKESGAGVINGKGVNNDPGLVGTVRLDQPSNVADDENKATTPEVQHHVSRRYGGPRTSERFRELRLDSDDKLPVPERPMPPEIQQSSDPLVKLVWEARESSRRRLLTTDQHTPWQLMHGLLGLRQDFVVNHNGRIINGQEWIQSGPTFKDEPPFQEDQPWFQKTKHGGRAHPYLRPYLFEGHINQFAAILALCGLPLTAQFGTPDGPITMQDLITNAQMTANEKEEVSWTLSLLSRYLPPDARWANEKGEEWSIERLVKLEVGKTVGGPNSPCGGTCGLFALAIARNEYQRSGKPLEGVWMDAEQKVRKYIQTARMQQNSNGTLSSNYFRGREYKQDFDGRLASSGAVLQFLMTAASDEQLKEDWLRRGVEATANDLMTNRKASVNCSSLFETTNALSIYLDRLLLSEQIASLPSTAGHNLVGLKPQSEVEKPEVSVPNMIATYPVADLVVPIHNVVAKVAGPVDAARAADSATAVAPSPASDQASDDRLDAPGRAEELLNIKADFAPLTELIKATVQPESWEKGLAIQVEEKTLSLIIQQTAKAHQEIQELLSQLRNAQDQSVRIQCTIFKLLDGVQSKWLEEQVSLHALQNGTRWALLSKQRSETFALSLLEQKPEVFSRPVLRTISGQTTTITVGQSAVGGTAITGIRLEVTPHVLPYSKVIRMQHSFSIGKFTNEMPQPVESLVGSGQTLLLLIDDPEDNEKHDAEMSQYLLMMTPEHIEEVEEEVSGATSDDSADAVDDTPRGYE